MKAALHVAEPPARYRARLPAVVDCSVVVGALFNEHWRDVAQEKLAGCELHAPFLLQAEFASVALKKMRQGHGELAADAIAQFGAMTLELHAIDPAEVVALAAAYQLSAYDAAYLWLAGDLGFALVTFDERLAAGARQHLGSLQ